MTIALCETKQEYEELHEIETYDALTGRAAICEDNSAKEAGLCFGEYLLYDGKIDEYELSLSLDFQKQKHLTIGILAVQEGVLDDKQLCDILDCQRLRGNVLFGELAVELGFLSQDDVDTLLEMQDESHIKIGEVLILLGAITREDMEKELKEFHSVV